MSETYEPGELFVYMNGDHWELGEVKCANNTGTGYFCWYSTGDTAANTPTSHMHKLANSGWSHIEKLREIIKRVVRCRDCAKWSFFDTEDGKRIGDCAEWTHLDGFSNATDEDGFCKWGERRGA